MYKAVIQSDPIKVKAGEYIIPILKNIQSDIKILRSDGNKKRAVVWNEESLLAGKIEIVTKQGDKHYLNILLNNNTKAGSEMISDLNFIIDNKQGATFELSLDGDNVTRLQMKFDHKHKYVVEIMKK